MHDLDLDCVNIRVRMFPIDEYRALEYQGRRLQNSALNQSSMQGVLTFGAALHPIGPIYTSASFWL